MVFALIYLLSVQYINYDLGKVRDFRSFKKTLLYVIDDSNCFL